MKNYYRVMLGAHSALALGGGFIGADYGIAEDFSQLPPERWNNFNSYFIPKFLEKYPDKTKIAAGLAGGFIWHIAHGIRNGDIVLCMDDSGVYHVGEVHGEFYYHPGDALPHRRPVQWRNVLIERESMGEELKRSIASGAVCNLNTYAEEIERLIGGQSGPQVLTTDPTIVSPSEFAMEQHLEEFLVRNWSQSDLGRDYDIYEVDGVQVGRQYVTDTGPLDILAISKDKKRLLVVELKKGRASDAVVGQALRYMGFVQDELADEGQTVHGAIIAHEDDQRIRRALSMTPNIAFFRYQVSFKLVKV